MGKVRVLPPEVASKIAAGEVVERPASVVKELVENALDAGASRISVELEEGGMLSIRVVDDGEGMSPEDAEMALEHHATSKIHGEEDLGRILTYGFRGEALPSIAAVSRMTILTRAEGHPGFRIEVEGGRVLYKGEAGAPRGTTVWVRDLFFNLPARRKFLKSVSTELGHSVEAVVRLALPRPEVAFSVRHGTREVMCLLPAEPEERILMLFGDELEGKLVEVLQESSPLALRGWVTSPPYFRGNPKGIYFYVNKRYVRERMVLYLLSELYSDLIPRGTYPLAVLMLQIPPEEVDVNVHPQKAEVRFKDPERVFRFLKEALVQALGKGRVRAAPPPPPSPLQEVREPALSYQPLPLPQEVPRGPRPIGQFSETFLLAEEEGALLVFDQHALHERILYERFKGRRTGVQRLLVPLVLAFSEPEMERLKALAEDLAAFGLELEAFGPRSLVVKAIPSPLGLAEVKGVLEALADLEGGPKERLEEALKLMACKGALKAEQPLSLEEVKELLEQWHSLGRPRTCPHGRPLLWEIRPEELSRKFKRLP